jgi:nicotinamide-nucleotide amidase
VTEPSPVRGTPEPLSLAPAVRSSAAEVAASVLAALEARGETLATAESLTGGLIGATLTAVPGASRSYRGGVVSYATDLKATLAGVPAAILSADGPVAPTTAEAMARGVAERCAASWGLAVTGVAGPDAQDGHPVGEIYVGLWQAAAGHGHVAQLALQGDREEIRAATVRSALELLLRRIR